MTALVMLNLLVVGTAAVIQQQVFVWVDDMDVAAVIGGVSSLMMFTSMGVLTLLCSWGPGPLWLRSLVLLLAIVVFTMMNKALEFTLDSLVYESYYLEAGVGLQLLSGISTGLSIAVPMMMVLSMFAALGRWRIGPPKIGPIRVRIIDVMIGTAALAFLFVINAEIQHRYYEDLFGDPVAGTDDFTSVDAQRYQTMVIAAVSAPIAAIVVAASAWTAYRLVAGLVLVAILLVITAISVAVDGPEAPSMIGFLLGAFAACGFVAANVRAIGYGGWPLTRRLAKPVPDAAGQPPPEVDAVAPSDQDLAGKQEDSPLIADTLPGNLPNESGNVPNDDQAKLDTDRHRP